MASMLQKFARMSRPAAFINAFHNSQPLKPAISNIFPILSDCHQTSITNSPFCGSLKSDNLYHSDFPVIYPSFSVGIPLNPILSTPFVPLEGGDAGLDESRIVWADSVKKKRKKKMNKHKYRKLRKRMSRQT